MHCALICSETSDAAASFYRLIDDSSRQFGSVTVNQNESMYSTVDFWLRSFLFLYSYNVVCFPLMLLINQVAKTNQCTIKKIIIFPDIFKEIRLIVFFQRKKL